MSPTRREFIRRFGIAVASALATRCTFPLGHSVRSTPEVTCYEVVAPTLTPPPESQLTRQADALATTVAAGDLPVNATRQATAALDRERLRALWLGLDALARSAQDELEESEPMRDNLIAEHRLVLDELVSLGELSEAVAEHVQAAFDAAACHTWRANVPVTCYEPMLIDWRPTGSADLIAQAELLAQPGDLVPATVAQVQAAIERDIAFLSLPTAEVEALYQRILGDRGADQPVPGFEEADLDVSAEAVEAAGFLVALLEE
jgi:hypothetical protein